MTSGYYVMALDAHSFQPRKSDSTCELSTMVMTSSYPFTGRVFTLCTSGQSSHFEDVHGGNLSQPQEIWQYRPVVRYTLNGTVPWGSAILTFTVAGSVDGSVCPSLQSEKTSVELNAISPGHGQAWISDSAMAIDRRCIYNILFTAASSNGASDIIMVDAIVLLPDWETSQLYQLQDSSRKATTLECVRKTMSIKTKSEVQSNTMCLAYVFSYGVQLQQGGLACDCDSVGTQPGSTCTTYGGQCTCKPGVFGRRCDSCIAGYYNFTVDGCIVCPVIPCPDDMLFADDSSSLWLIILIVVIVILVLLLIIVIAVICCKKEYRKKCCALCGCEETEDDKVPIDIGIKDPKSPIYSKNVYTTLWDDANPTQMSRKVNPSTTASSTNGRKDSNISLNLELAYDKKDLNKKVLEVEVNNDKDLSVDKDNRRDYFSDDDEVFTDNFVNLDTEELIVNPPNSNVKVNNLSYSVQPVTEKPNFDVDPGSMYKGDMPPPETYDNHPKRNSITNNSHIQTNNPTVAIVYDITPKPQPKHPTKDSNAKPNSVVPKKRPQTNYNKSEGSIRKPSQTSTPTTVKHRSREPSISSIYNPARGESPRSVIESPVVAFDSGRRRPNHAKTPSGVSLSSNDSIAKKRPQVLESFPMREYQDDIPTLKFANVVDKPKSLSPPHSITSVSSLESFPVLPEKSFPPKYGRAPNGTEIRTPQNMAEINKLLAPPPKYGEAQTDPEMVDQEIQTIGIHPQIRKEIDDLHKAIERQLKGVKKPNPIEYRPKPPMRNPYTKNGPFSNGPKIPISQNTPQIRPQKKHVSKNEPALDEVRGSLV